jgi:hypothetical protein
MGFYITLPSNSSMRHYPDNGPSHFYTQLPQTINLSSDYEVGLAEIQFPNSFLDVSGFSFWITLNIQVPESEKHLATTANNEAVFTYINQAVRPKIDIPSRVFETTEAFVRHIDETMKLNFHRETFKPQEHRVRMAYLPASRQVVLQLKAPEVVVTLSPHLQTVLGFSTNVFNQEGNYTSDKVVDLNRAFETVFVYCDLAQPRPVGDVLVPLLRSVPVLDKKKPITFSVFDKPHYIPISRLQFNTVEILLTTDSGDKVPFTDGKAVVTLHFRRSREEPIASTW